MRFPRVLAIDCGASRVSAVQFSATTDGVPVVNEVHVEPLEYDTADDHQWVRAVGDAIRHIGTSCRLKPPVSLIVPGHLTLTKYIKVPHVEESKRQKIINFEARQNIPYPLEEVVWDYQIVHDDGIDFEIVLCAIKLDIVEALLAECRDAGFEPACIEPSCMAQINAFHFCFPHARQSTLLINIGARSSNLLFIREDRYFIRNITLGGSAFSQSIADEIGQSVADAERHKLEIVRHGRDAIAPDVALAFDNARQSFATRLALEVTRSIANFRRQSAGDAPGTVFLTGAGSQVPELSSLLAEKLKVSVMPYEPLRGIPIDPGAVEGEIRASAHLIGEAVGAVLRIHSKGIAACNLLPARVVRAREFRTKQPFYLGAVAFILGSLAIGLLMNWVTVGAYREKINSLDSQARPLRRYSSEIKRVVDDSNNLRLEIDGIERLVATKSNWISFFTDLQSRLVKVEDVWLDKLQVIRPQGAQVQTSALAATMFANAVPTKPANANSQPQTLRLNLAGRLLDKNNPLSTVSIESQNRVKSLLASFVDSDFIMAIENERFDNSQPGILKFDFILVVNPKKPL